MKDFDTINVNYAGLHFTVDVSPEAFKVSNIRITDQKALADYLESDIEFDSYMLKLQHNKEEKEKLVCQKKHQQKEE